MPSYEEVQNLNEVLKQVPHMHPDKLLVLAVEKNVPFEVVKSVLGTKANPNVCDDDGTPVLNTAIENNDDKTVAVLLMYGADPHQTEENKYTAFHVAASESFSTITMKLLCLFSKNVSNATCCGGKTPFEIAIRRGDVLCVQEMLKRLPRRCVDERNSRNRNRTPLHVACDNDESDEIKINSAKIAEYLLQHGADPNATFDEGFASIHEAVCSQNAFLVEVLLNDPRTNPYQLTKNGHSALDFARARGYDLIVQKLVARQNMDLSKE